MAKMINAKCPNCGAVLELPENLDRAFCMHCGGKIIIANDIHYHESKPAIACPECRGKGIWECEPHKDINKFLNSEPIKISKYGDISIHPCNKSKKCNVVGIFIGGYYQTWSMVQLNTNRDRLPNVCNDGMCALCEGTGKIKQIFSRVKCEVCGGTGICRYCKGTGKCTVCNGTGKIKCETCNGTGFKVYQEV